MDKAKKYYSLRKVYYFSFAAMVVVPILLVFVLSLSVIRLMMQNSAISAIKSRQNTVISSLTESVQDASLQLSHMVYVNNNELVETASMTDTADPKVRNKYASQLDQLFQVAMAPKQTVISGMVYMNDGRYTYIKQELAIPREEVMASRWYEKAQEKPNTVTVGCYDTSHKKVTLTGGRSRELVIAVALSPDIGVDRSEKIDMIVLFFRTRIGSLLADKAYREGLGDTVLLDEEGNLVFRGGSGDTAQDFLSLMVSGKEKGGRMGGKVSAAILEEAQAGSVKYSPEPAAGVYQRRLPGNGLRGGGNYTLVISDIPEMGWKLASCVKTHSLTAGFNRVASLMLAVIGGLFLLYASFSRFFLQSIIRPVHTMVEGLRQVEEGNLETHIEPAGQAEIRQMIHSFNRTVRQLKTSVEEREKAQEKKLEAQVRALQSQINPHFLVNSLTSIRFMAQVSKFDGIRRMAEALIQILTCSFRSNSSFYTVREELGVLDSYLYLMKIRYSDGFEVSYQVDPACLDRMMPRLVLQPVVENSIVHGFADMGEGIGQLIIRVSMEEERFCLEEERLCLEVEDNGAGMGPEKIAQILKGKVRRPDDNYSIGIENVFSRLSLHFKEAFQMEMESEPGVYTKTRILIPAEKKQEEGHESGDNR